MIKNQIILINIFMDIKIEKNIHLVKIVLQIITK
jgi:hypothetical protein